MAIRNVRHNGLRRLFEQGEGSKLHPAHVNRIRDSLLALDGADALNELSEPFYRLHPLKGDRKGQRAVTVSRMWRIVFRIEGDDGLDVDLTDYHQEGIMSESNGSVSYDAWLRRHPSHPGRHIYHGCMQDPLGESSLTVSEAAHKIGVSRVTLSRVLNGRASISVSLALKLEAAGWGKADAWSRRQAQYDLAREQNRLGQWPGGATDPEDAKIAAEAR